MGEKRSYGHDCHDRGKGTGTHIWQRVRLEILRRASHVVASTQEQREGRRKSDTDGSKASEREVTARVRSSSEQRGALAQTTTVVGHDVQQVSLPNYAGQRSVHQRDEPDEAI